MKLLDEIMMTFRDTLVDISPIVFVVVFFQMIIIKKRIPNLKKTLLGLSFVIVGLTLLLLGLDKALFPVGELMAVQLTTNDFLAITNDSELSNWFTYIWVYIFALTIGFSSAMAEPTLKAVSSRVEELSGGLLKSNAVRIVVATGSGLALLLGCLRIVLHIPLEYILMVIVFIITIQTLIADKNVISLAYDIGVVTTSTITVPIVTAIGIGLASVIPGSNPAIDGFGLVMLICLMPIVTMLTYSIIITVKK